MTRPARYYKQETKLLKSPGDYAYRIADNFAPDSDVVKALFVTGSTLAQGAAIGAAISVFTTSGIGIAIGLLYGSYIANGDKLLDLYDKAFNGYSASNVKEATDAFVGLDAANSGNLESLESLTPLTVKTPEIKVETYQNLFSSPQNDTVIEPHYAEPEFGLFLHPVNLFESSSAAVVA